MEQELRDSFRSRFGDGKVTFRDFCAWLRSFPKVEELVLKEKLLGTGNFLLWLERTTGVDLTKLVAS